MTTATVDIDLGSYKLGWSDPEDDLAFSAPGSTRTRPR